MKYKLYKQLASYYDLIYASKDYRSEFEYQNKLIQKYKKSKGKDLLEVACGTGRYLEHSRKKYNVSGTDLNPEMLQLAKKKLPGVKLLAGDMRSFDFKQQFDVVTCLFSSIGYMKNVKELTEAIANFEKHLKPGGVILVSPWIRSDKYKSGKITLMTYETEKLKIARMAFSKIKKPNISHINFSWLISEWGKGTSYVSDDIHELTMFNEADFKKAFTNGGLTPKFITRGKESRGLYIATKPL